MTILCYHTVEEGWTSSLSLEPQDFDAHCAWLAANRTVVDLRTATAALDARYRAPAGMVALTFDDGFAGLFEHALPILLRHRLPATIFVVADTLTEAGHPVDWVDGDPPIALGTLSLDQVLAMRDEGIEFGSHSLAHADLTTLDEARCVDDLRCSREVLEDLLQQAVPTLAYPRGRHNATVRGAAACAGFEYAYSLPQGPEPVGPFAVPRVGVFGGNSLGDLRVKTSSWYPSLRRSRAFGALRRVRAVGPRRGAAR